MICKACNAHLSLEDEKCPYCGTPNAEAVRHRQEMHQFSGEFHKTRSRVLLRVSESAEKSVRIILLCVMSVLLIVSLLFLGYSWDISYGIQKLQSKNQSKKISAMLDEYEENGDFLAFAALYDEKYLYSIDEFEEYRHVYTAASNYKSIFGYITTLLEEEHWEEGHENALEYLSEALEYHYEYIEQEPYEFYYEMGAYKEQHLDAVERVTAKIEALLQLTFDMTDEELEAFRGFSSAEKQVFIERRFEGHE